MICRERDYSLYTQADTNARELYTVVVTVDNSVELYCTLQKAFTRIVLHITQYRAAVFPREHIDHHALESRARLPRGLSRSPCTRVTSARGSTPETWRRTP